VKVVLINCSYDTFTPTHSGAIGTWVYEVCRAAREADGVRPLVISRSSVHTPHDWEELELIDYPHLPSSRLASKFVGLQKRLNGWVRPRQGAYEARVAEAIERRKAMDGALVLHNDMELAVGLRRRFPEACIVHVSHNQVGTTPKYQRRFGAAVDVAAACSSFTARWNETFYGLAAGSVRTLHNGVALDRFRPRRAEERGSEAGRCVISFMGRLDSAKGADVLLDAALLLAARRQDFALKIMGRPHYDRDTNDPFVEGLRAKGADLERRGVRCEFAGWVHRTHLPEALRECEIHVTPSRWDEPFGLTTLEAMASGLAVVASDTGGTGEVVGNAGLLFPREDAAALADRLESLLADGELRRSLGRRARARAETFGWGQTWRTLVSLVAEAERRRHGSARTAGAAEVAS
jgi:glycosyltransferase involved in cell wall biosynthesis